MLKERYFVVGDIHIPFHNPKLTELVFSIAKDSLSPGDTIFLNGDIGDLYSLNSHGPTHPDVAETLHTEMVAIQEFISWLRREFPEQKIIYQLGNHEDRYDRWVVKHSKPFHGLLRFEDHLQLERYDIEYYPYNNAYQVPGTNIKIQHSPPSYSVNSARTSLVKNMGGRWIWGCTHRPDKAYLKGQGSSYHEAHCLGWLGSTDLTDKHKRVFSYRKGHDNWGHSFGQIDIVGNKSFITQTIIRNNSCVHNGIYYEV